MSDRTELVVVKQEPEPQEDVPSIDSPETQQVDAGPLGLLLPVKLEPDTDDFIKREIEIEIGPTELYQPLSFPAPHTQTKQEIDNFVIETHNDQNTSNLRHYLPARVDYQAAERSRLYRERHREEINKRRRKQKTSQLIPATAAERNRKYRERNKQQINKRRRESRLRQQHLQQIHTEATADDQQSLNTSNDDIEEIAQHNTQYSKTTQNGRVQTTAALQTTEGTASSGNNENPNNSITEHLLVGKAMELQNYNIYENKTSNIGHFKEHIKLEENEIFCNVCHYKYASKKSLKVHMRTHTSDKPYSCNVCEYKFRQKVTLTRHMRTHTSDKPYSCNVCEYIVG